MAKKTRKKEALVASGKRGGIKICRVEGKDPEVSNEERLLFGSGKM